MSRPAKPNQHGIGTLICLMLMYLAPVAAVGQQTSTPVLGASVQQRIAEIQAQSQRRDNPLAELLEFEKLDAEHRSDPDYPGNLALTMLYETHSFLSNHAAALRAYDERYDRYLADFRTRNRDAAAGSSDLAALQAVSALTVLDELGDSAQVIMISEAHHLPRHRVFTQQALVLLRKKGFAYFAAEAFGDQDIQLQQRGYPILRSGRYTREPMFAEMVRTAIREGYELIPYEGPMDGGSDAREQAQARNLIERVLKRDPKAKLVVHAGYGHIFEQQAAGESKRMAQYFKEWSGIDPLTINQTQMMEHSEPDYEDPRYATVIEKYGPSHAIVLRNAAGDPWSAQPGVHDLTVFHPRTTYQNGRPTWLVTEAGRRPYVLPNQVCGAAKICLVQARLASESDAAIAIDQIEVKTGQALPAILLLPVGQFNIDVQDAAGTRIRRLTAKMSAARK